MSFMSPLRWKIAAGYLVVVLITIFLWKDVESGWAALATFLAPLATFFAALVALKFSVVLAALGTFLIVFLQGFVGMIVVVAKMGVIKGLFLPWLLSGLQWLHKKSEFLQRWVNSIYVKGKEVGKKLYDWWFDQNVIDRVLLLGFVGPLIFIVAFVLLLKRIVYMFISKKAAEQIVQRVTKASVKNFHKIPVVGQLPDQVKTKARQLKHDRDKKLADAEGLSTDSDNQA